MVSAGRGVFGGGAVTLFSFSPSKDNEKILLSVVIFDGRVWRAADALFKATGEKIPATPDGSTSTTSAIALQWDDIFS